MSLIPTEMNIGVEEENYIFATSGSTELSHGNDMSWIPQSSIRLGGSQADYTSPNRFRDHGAYVVE